MNKEAAEFPATPKESFYVLEKDLKVIRMIGYNNHAYQYQLFHKEEYKCNHLSNYEYKYGVVTVNPNDGTMILTMRDASNMNFTSLEDDNVLLVEVTIKS